MAALTGVADRTHAEAQEIIDRVARTFSLATRLLPPSIRSDVNLLYLVLRGLDDAVDQHAPDAAERLDAVQAWSSSGAVAGREAELLDHLAVRHPAFPRDAIADFCVGQRHDLDPVPFLTERDLDRYCYRVAGTVGRIMAVLLGTVHRDADWAARALGIAMQRTNILRDIDEDLAEGRNYLPQETLQLAGVVDLARGDRSLLLRIEVAIADWWYAQGMAGIRHLAQGRAAIRAGALMYREILHQLGRDGWGSRRPWRARVATPRRALIIVRSLVP
jgi:15-cis-phytoene synthase